MKYIKTYEGKLEDDYTWWFGENIHSDSPIINSIKNKIKLFSPEFLTEFYYRMTNDDDPVEVIGDIFDKSNIEDEDALIYFKELKRRAKRRSN